MIGQKGFTLVEAMGCLAIVGVLSTIAYPEFRVMRQNFQHRAMVMDLAADLQRAKLEAIKENHFVVVELSEQEYRIFVDNGAGGSLAADWQKQDEERLVLSRSLQQAVRLSSNFPDDKLRFSGIAGTQPGTITLRSGHGTAFDLVISRVGRVRVAGPHCLSGS